MLSLQSQTLKLVMGLRGHEHKEKGCGKSAPFKSVSTLPAEKQMEETAERHSHSVLNL